MRFFVVTIACLAGFACAPPPRPIPPTPPTPATPPGTDECAAASTGGLVIDGLEGEAGYDEALAALDPASLPEELPLDVTGLQRDIVLYMLERDSFDPESPASIVRDEAQARGALGVAVLGAYAAGDGALDFAFLRRGLHRFYACDRGFPLTLRDFNARVVDVSAIPEAETVDSDVKGLPRRMRRSGPDGVFVAETLVAAGGPVRETEIILTDRRQDGAIEFIEYDEDGNLRSASSFATSTGGESVGAVPFTCMACHGTHNVTP